jgi:hypothetical protein
MRQPPRRLVEDLPLIPIGVLGAEVTQEHAPRAAVHPAGNAQALGPGLGAKDLRHFVVQHLNVQRQLRFHGFHAFTLSLVSE